MRNMEYKLSNYKFRKSVALRAVKLLNVILITFAFSLCWFNYYLPRTISPFYFWGSVLLLALFFILYLFLGKLYDGFVLDLSRISEIIYSQFLAYSITDLLFYVIICLLSKKIVNVFPGVLCLLGQILVSSIWAYFSHLWFFKIYEPVSTAVVYQENDDSLFGIIVFPELIFNLHKLFSCIFEFLISKP